ncbi:hypothetical protein ESB00_17545 [Oleiharenicola lentus]|uniref:Uncharacterized protein n=1 Tax=Oleiharenicola lentus TaxID=2508720 RepID=A0A4Q1C4Y6_9BACT|nr:hypothetical protein ESB00_17545 [Oleiharenicola lentus]
MACGLVVMVCLPLAPVADDRIVVAKDYERALAWDELGRQLRNRWSVLRILQRAARRQECMNRRGQEKFDELQSRKWDLAYGLRFQAAFMLRVFGICYGAEALGAALEQQYPLLSEYYRAGDAALSGFLRWFLNLPGPDQQDRLHCDEISVVQAPCRAGQSYSR